MVVRCGESDGLHERIRRPASLDLPPSAPLHVPPAPSTKESERDGCAWERRKRPGSLKGSAARGPEVLPRVCCARHHVASVHHGGATLGGGSARRPGRRAAAAAAFQPPAAQVPNKWCPQTGAAVTQKRIETERRRPAPARGRRTHHPFMTPPRRGRMVARAARTRAWSGAGLSSIMRRRRCPRASRPPTVAAGNTLR